MNILNILANDNYFIYNKDIAKHMGTDVAIILGLLCNRYNYYQKENKLTIIDNKEYFYCTRETIYDETGLKESCQRKAMKILEDINILEYKKIGIPSKNYYYINTQKLLQTLENLSSLKNKGLEVQENNDLSLKNDTQIINNNIKKENINIEYNVEQPKSFKIDLELKENIKCIIDYLNETANTKYKYSTRNTVSLIKARFKEGYTLDDFYDVIDNKWKDWKNTEWQQYIRPETLFGNKFESYLNGKVFTGKPKSRYSSTPTFDNTSNHNIKIHHISDEEFNKLTHEQKLKEIEKFDAIANMTPMQREFFNEFCLARDENGNLLKF